MSSDQVAAADAAPGEKTEDEEDKTDEKGGDEGAESKTGVASTEPSESSLTKKTEEDEEEDKTQSVTKTGDEERTTEMDDETEDEGKSELEGFGVKSEIDKSEDEEGDKSLMDYANLVEEIPGEEEFGKIDMPLSWGGEEGESDLEGQKEPFGLFKFEEYGEEGDEDEEEEEGEEKALESSEGSKGSEEEESVELDIYEQSTEEEAEELDEDRKDEWKPGMKIHQFKTAEEGDEEVEEEEVGDFISVPDLSPITSFKEDFLEFYHSFGYDCRRHYNICVPDKNTVIFASGNYINFFDVPTRKLTFRRSARGGGLGHIVKNPKYPHIAVGEKGEKPLIIIYDWPSMERVVILRGGTKKGYASLHYSPDGEYLCSQGKEDDYNLTVWRWKRGKILRQQKAYGQDVLNAMFSQYNTSNLTTSGFAHIKFWKLTKTFTGIKLMGSIGRFGKTEMCDIIGFVALPDEQVISGCEWGNMLIWDEGLVKSEVTRKGAPCHEGYISQLLFDHVNSEIVSVGTDGCVRSWDFKLIEKADITEQDNKIVLEALHTLEVGKDHNKSQLRYIQKQDDDPSHSDWFAQDANGGIWLIDLDQDNAKLPEKIFTCHAGGILSVSCCPNDKYVATFGEDGRVIFYNYLTKKLVLCHKFAAGGGFMVWPPLSIEPSGCVVICGGSDGMIRVIVVALGKREAAGDKGVDREFVRLVQTTKPHTSRITYMVVDEPYKILVTGSEDATIFVYQIVKRSDYMSLNPIGFVRLGSEVTHIACKEARKATVLVSCRGGEAVEMEIPDIPELYTKVSYELTSVQKKTMVFISVKSQIRRDLFLEELAKKKEAKVEMKKEKLKEMKKDNPHLKIDEDLFLEDSESEVSLESLYYPPVPSSILFSKYITDDIVWMCPAGYDAGYIYEYKFGIEEPFRATMMTDADDIEIHSFLHDCQTKTIYLGMQNGKIRVCPITDYGKIKHSDYWELSVHDNDNGIIPQMCFSYDLKYFFSCGHDGNLFAFTVTSQASMPPPDIPPPKIPPWPKDELEDIDDQETFSLEQLKDKAEYDRKMKLANEHKEGVLKELEVLKEKFAELVESNEELPLKIKIPDGDFIIDHRIEDDLDDELQDIVELEKRKIAFEAEKSGLLLEKIETFFYNCLESQIIYVHAIRNPKIRAYTFRHRSLPNEYHAAVHFMEKKMKERMRGESLAARKLGRAGAGLEGTKPLPLGSWLKGLSSVGTNVKMNLKLQRMLLKYYERKRRLEVRKEQWVQMMKAKPDPNVSHPDDIAAMEHAQRTIGDYKLKTDPEYSTSGEKRVTMAKKFQQILETRKKIFDMQKDYSAKIYDLRIAKEALLEHINDLRKQLQLRHLELPEEEIKYAPEFAEYPRSAEYPEDDLRLKKEDVMAEYTKIIQAQEKAGEESDEDMNREFFESDESVSHTSPEVKESIVTTSMENTAPLDSDYEILLSDGKDVPTFDEEMRAAILRSDTILAFEEFFSADQFLSDLNPEYLTDNFMNDSRDTIWEQEMRYRRLCRSLHTQDEIIREINDSVDEYDRRLVEAKNMRFQVAVEVKFGELRLIKLHQEIIILKDFEAHEDILQAKVTKTEMCIDDERNMIADLEENIEGRLLEIENLHVKEKQLLAVFNETIEDNNYSDFLKKIYKKKYKPPKEKKGEDESSSESSMSSSSSSEEEGSYDSQDLDVIKLDESICPPDLDREIYDTTFKLRGERHKVEIQETEEKKMIEINKKEIENIHKKIRGLERELNVQQEELREFQREKQHRLNEVMCTVALKASQLQFFDDPAANLFQIQNKLVFSHKVLKELTHRVGELHKETIHHKKKLVRYKHHYQRMCIDCKEMLKIINNLKVDIDDCLLKKFGCLLKVDELEDIILQRLIQEMKSPLQELTEEFFRVAEVLKKEIRKKQSELTVLFVNNTEKMSVLAILERERDQLRILLKRNAMLKKRVTYKDLFESSAELKRLFRIVRNQGGRTLMLKAEIRAFTYKDKPPPSPVCSPSMYAMELKEALWEESPCRDIESVSSEEETDENLFLYMEDQKAMDLLAEREGLEHEETMPMPQDILDQLLRRVPPSTAESDRGEEEEGKVEKLLDEVILELLNKIPPTETATSIFDEVMELLLARLDCGKDSERLKAVLWDIVVDMRSFQATPSRVREIFEMVFKNMKWRETRVCGTLEARAILYDIIRKCLGCVLGKRFVLATEEALMKVLEALAVEEKQDLLDEILRTMEEQVDISDNRYVKEALEEAIHDMESLGAHEALEQICRQVFERLRERAGPERAMLQARHAYHEAIKKAMGIVTETENPLWERESFDADKATVMILLKLPKMVDLTALYDEMCMQLEWRDQTRDSPIVHNLLEIVTKETCEEPPDNMDAMLKRINKLLRAMRHETDDKGQLACAYAVLYDAVRRSVLYNYPETPVEPIHRSLEGGAAVLGLLDKLPASEDNSGLVHEITERGAYAMKMLLMSDGVQQLLGDIRQDLEKIKDKSSDFKNICAKMFANHKGRNFKRKDFITTFRLLFDIFRYALDDVYPNINLEDDPDVMKAVQSILRIVDIVEPQHNKPVVTALKEEISEWVPKRSDSNQVAEKIALVIENLTQLPQGIHRLRNTFSHIFKLIYNYNANKALSLRVLAILRYNLKAAIRTAIPDHKLDVDICHFNPDDTLLAMMAKVPISLYTTRLCSVIRGEMTRMIEQSEKITPDIRKMFEFVDEYLEQVTEKEPDIYGAMEDALQDMRNLDMPPLENVYGRIYLNYIVRRAMTSTVPRVDIKEATCNIDKGRPTVLLLHKIPRSDTGTVQLWDELVEELQSRFETVEDQPEVSMMIRNAVVELTCTQPQTPSQAIHIFRNCFATLQEEKVALLEMLTAKNIFYESMKESMERCFPLLDLDDGKTIDKDLPIIQMLAQLPVRAHYRNLVDAIVRELVAEEKELEDDPEKHLLAEFIDELRRGPMVSGDLAHVYPCYAKIRDMEWPVKVFKDFKEIVYASIKRAILEVFPNLALQDNQSAWEAEEALLISSLALPDTDDPSPLIDEVRERIADVRATMLLTENVKRLLQEIEHHLSVMPLEPGNYEYVVTCMLTVLNERSGRHLDIARIRTVMYDVMRDAIHMIADRIKVRGQIRSEDPFSVEDYD